MPCLRILCSLFLSCHGFQVASEVGGTSRKHCVAKLTPPTVSKSSFCLGSGQGGWAWTSGNKTSQRTRLTDYSWIMCKNCLRQGLLTTGRYTPLPPYNISILICAGTCAPLGTVLLLGNWSCPFACECPCQHHYGSRLQRCSLVGNVVGHRKSLSLAFTCHGAQIGF